jgi:hypothetical protein
MILFYLHTCGRCGARIRRYRQRSSAAWFKRNHLEPKAWPLTWHDTSGSTDCSSVQARRERKERGERDTNWGPDARHAPSIDEFSDGSE